MIAPTLQDFMKQDHTSPYANAGMIASYTDDAPRKVPGLADLHRMMMLLLAEQAPSGAHILVLGAGGGLETKALAEAQPSWQLTGVDPSPAMLDLARRTIVPFSDRISLVEGTVDQAPAGPFDGATCLLTLHHIERSERLRTLKEIHRRLKPGVNIVIAGHSAPEPDPIHWITRSVAFGDRRGLDPATAANTGKLMAERLHLLTPAEEKEMLQEAGFLNVAMFYAAFSFRGWVGTARSR
ncbi:class I SAM-dependent methyltransferase [Pseudomonas mucidolens]|uniref:class I SAM-dependent methyltransferase n=1 Tax=Pseudomonas mucidolens TaxID=46679 RepID=UPI001E5C3A3A|nr:class I SAM-dependent methyltransferase [Pseudomonas mucidolens]